MRSLIITALLAVALGDDRIIPGTLPGWNGNQAMYAGYVNVNISHG